MLLINAVNAEGRPVELYVKDGKIAAVGQDLAALAGENETVLDAGRTDRAARFRGPALPLAHAGLRVQRGH